jgi:GT2 family glycosyltransferase
LTSAPSALAARLSVIVVTYKSAEDVRLGLPAVLAQLDDGDELIVLDNASPDDTVRAVSEVAGAAALIRSEQNVGFAAGCNQAARAATGDLLVFLNPDAVPAPGFCRAIRAPLREQAWDAWMGLLTQDEGQRVNTWGNVVHFTGLGWAGGVGELAPAQGVPGHEVPYLSGGCLAIPAETWRSQRGFPEPFFMYSEDLDLSLRVRLAGGRLGVEPAARVEHRYEFHKGADKWRRMERNRWLTVLRTYPTLLLVVVLPAMLVTDLALILIAFASGWGPQKLRAVGEVMQALPRVLQERRQVQASRRITATQFASWLTADLSSPYLGRVARSKPLTWGLRSYWRVVLRLLRAIERE